jgi:hypothetical protein
MTGLLHHRYGEEEIPLGVMPPSLGGLALVAAIGLIWRILPRRPMQAVAGLPGRPSETQALVSPSPGP